MRLVWTIPAVAQPRQGGQIPFRNLAQDLLMWPILSVDMEPAQLIAAIIVNLEGPARELARNLSWNEINHRGSPDSSRTP